MVQLRPDMPIIQRRALIAEALAKVLNRGPEMSVEGTGASCSDLAVWVHSGCYTDVRVAFEIDDIARDLEVLL